MLIGLALIIGLLLGLALHAKLIWSVILIEGR